MTFRYPHLDQQFVPRDNTSSVDCAATAGAILADADSKGKLDYTHSQVRQHTNEYPPDWAGSPGLTWQQVDASLFRLSNGRVNLDVHPGGSAWSTLTAALRAGKWAGVAVQRSVLVNAGYAAGSTFRGAHAEVYGYDQDRKKFVMGDPLVPRWIDVPATVMARAALGFLLANGYTGGGAYYALTRDVYDAAASTLRYSVLFAVGSFWRYEPGAPWTRKALAFAHATSAPCDPPLMQTFNGVQKKLVRVRAGSLAGYYVEPGNGSVSLKVTK